LQDINDINDNNDIEQIEDDEEAPAPEEEPNHQDDDPEVEEQILVVPAKNLKRKRVSTPSAGDDLLDFI
jgi:hypothetical protein